MFGKIIAINKNYAIVQVNNNFNVMSDLLNIHVVFEDTDKRILGEIEDINQGQMKINFLGEISDTSFISGVINRPKIDSKIRIINANELNVLVGNKNESINLGVSPLYKNYPVYVTYNDLFSNHTAIFGNSGSGKTYGICRILQNVFMNSTLATNSNIFIFDSYGEYISALSGISKYNSNLCYKLISTDNRKDSVPLNIPVSMLSLDDVLNLLDADRFGQIAIVETALNLVKIFASESPEVLDYKNHIIAKAILNIMYSNQTTSKMRDQIFDILSKVNTPQFNLEVDVPGVGFTRKFRSCFDIDREGRFAEIVLISGYTESFIKEDKKWEFNTNDVTYDLNDLMIALNFTLFSDRYLLNDAMYDEAISLKAKLSTLINSENGKFFTKDKFANSEEFIKSLVMSNDKKAQIININMENIDDRFARSLTKIFSRIFLNYTKSLENRASNPIHIVLEEAHRYVIKNDDVDLLGYNIFERIAKEGRKYGLILDIITQRPTDLNSNLLSQISNYLIFKITHPTDLEYISKMIPNISEDIIEKQKGLQSGTCVAFGKIFKIPMIVKFLEADPPPESSNADIYRSWISYQ